MYYGEDLNFKEIIPVHVSQPFPVFKVYMHGEGALVCIPWRAGACGVQKEVPDHLELELQVAICYSMWVLGAKLGSSAKAVHVFNC